MGLRKISKLGRVPPRCKLNGGTVPPWCKLNGGTVPPFNFVPEKIKIFDFFLIGLVLVRRKSKIIIMNKFRENDHKITEQGAG